MKLTKEQAQRFSELMTESAMSFLSRPEGMSTADWLEEYLTQNSTRENAADVIKSLALQKSLYSDMKISLSKTSDATEDWMLEQLESKGFSTGEQAKRLSACGIGFSEPDALNGFDTLPEENWANDKWDEFNLKKLAVQVATAAGNAGRQLMENMADGMAFAPVPQDGGNIDGPSQLELLESGNDTEAVIAAALDRAVGEGVLPEGMTTAVCGYAANVMADGVEVMKQVANNEIDIVDGIRQVEDNAAAAGMAIAVDFAAPAIGGAVGAAFGMPEVGKVVGGVLGKVFKEPIVKIGMFVREKVQQVKAAVVDKVVEKVPFLNKLKALFA